ncbi:uncharacterized protein LOC143264821 [Megachile rotundata]|uniref:uncharacterized protein LOC143264821 n=1 Tax=Megachile rotundata TaxID=143995 RepID=UPI003FCF1FF8
MPPTKKKENAPSTARNISNQTNQQIQHSDLYKIIEKFNKTMEHLTQQLAEERAKNGKTQESSQPPNNRSQGPAPMEITKVSEQSDTPGTRLKQRKEETIRTKEAAKRPLQCTEDTSPIGPPTNKNACRGMVLNCSVQR